MNIETRHEARRGCGFRKAGGTYLCSGGYGRYCGALPIPLDICPTCKHGIKPARGWTWLNLAELVGGLPTTDMSGGQIVVSCRLEKCGDCPIADGKIQEVGLIWVGEKFYPTPASFSDEANRLGISRRISAIPRKFKLGETWVALAHRNAIPQPFALADAGEPSFKAGIFHIFKPVAIEYVVREDDSEEKLERLVERGFTLVRVIPIEDKVAA